MPLQVHQFYWYSDIFFYLFVITLIAIFILTYNYIIRIKSRVHEMEIIQQQHVAKIDNIRREHSVTLESIRIEMLRRESERNRQWIESEKETLHVLNGVSTLLDLSDKIGRTESDRILKKLDELQLSIKNNINNDTKKDNKIKGN